LYQNECAKVAGTVNACGYDDVFVHRNGTDETLDRALLVKFIKGDIHGYEAGVDQGTDDESMCELWSEFVANGDETMFVVAK
jgi:hypothetical protein